MLLHKLIQELDKVLKPEAFDDYCHNGLQVQGKGDIKHIVTAVSSSQILIDEAVRLQADAILVHHGLFWSDDKMCLTGMLGRRVKALILNDINLLAYHLPLDAHPEYGNNAQLAKLLGFKIKGTFADIGSVEYAFYGELEKPMPALDLAQKIAKVFGREPLLIDTREDSKIKTVAWCSGGAQNLIDEAAKLKVDAYISGEISEHTVHKARELGINYFAAGHHASERYGVQAVGNYLQDKFKIKHTYVELDNPV